MEIKDVSLFLLRDAIVGHQHTTKRPHWTRSIKSCFLLHVAVKMRLTRPADRRLPFLALRRAKNHEGNFAAPGTEIAMFSHQVCASQESTFCSRDCATRRRRYHPEMIPTHTTMPLPVAGLSGRPYNIRVTY